MRYLLVRIWASLAIALFAGALGDGGTEFFSAFGWLRSSVHDLDQQAVLPTLVLALLVGIGLVTYIVATHIAPSDPLLRKLDDPSARITDAFVSFSGAALTVIAMEGYETRFGGLAPFDAHSIIVVQGSTLVIAFLIIASIARVVLGSVIRGAAQSGAAVAALFSSFSCVRRINLRIPKHATLPHPDTSDSHTDPKIVHARGLRAPPRLALSLPY